MGGSSQKILDTKHLWRWHTLAPLLGLGSVVLLTIFNPFGFESITKYQSEKVFYKIYGAAYPAKMRDDISVVLLDNETLRYFDERWPPSYSTQAKILRAILGYDPAAVFVDIFFDHVHPEDNFGDLKDAILHNQNPSLPKAPDQKKKARVPLLVAWDHDVRPEIWGLVDDPRSRGQPVSADIKGDPNQPPLYPLHPVPGHPEPAAVALYRLICDTPGSGDEGGSLARIRDNASGCKKKYLIDPHSDRVGHGSTSENGSRVGPLPSPT